MSIDVPNRAGAIADAALDLHRPGPDSASDRPLSDLASDLGKDLGKQLATETTEGVPEVAILQLVGKAGLLTADHIADRLFKHEAEDLVAAVPRTEAKLHRLLLKGYLEHRTVAYELAGASTPSGAARAVGGVAFDRGYTITQKASQDFNLPLPPTLRESFLTHHVKTMEAIWHVERDYRARGYHVLDWKTESELVRDNFEGKVFRRGVIVPKFPDAQITVQAPDGTSETVNIEYVSRSYTDKMIDEKRSAFAGTKTIWACPSDSPSTVSRVAALTGEEPLTV
jgi:hypothetical protein